MCASGNQCISIATMCDGTVNCDDGSDEDSVVCEGLRSYYLT